MGVPFDTHSSKRVTYVLATKNRASLLSTALDEIRDYITPEDELIVVDGQSDDDTLRVLERNSDLVDKLISEPDKNAAHAVNKALLLANGRYIRANADDDVLHPQAMEQAIQVLDEHPDVDVLVCGGTKQYTGQPSFEVWLPPGVNYGSSTEDIFRHKGSGSGLVIRRSALSLTGLVPSGLAADHEFLLESIYRGATVKFCRINLFHHVVHEGSYTVKHGEDFIKDEYRLLGRYCSLRFYVRIRSVWFLRKHQRWGTLVKQCNLLLRLPQRAWNKGARTLRSGATNSSSTSSKSLAKSERWDAGFS